MTITASMDIETMSTKSTGVILSMGICFFDDEKEQPFDEIVASGIEMFFDRYTQEKGGRHVESSTVQWWSEQGDAAKRCLNPEETITPREFHATLEAFCTKQDLSYNWVKKYCRWFTRGPHFDIAMADSMLDGENVSPPWKYFKVRDIRTWLECHGMPDNLKLVKPAGMIAHNALHDAAFDAWMMQQVLHTDLDQLDIEDKERKAA